MKTTLFFYLLAISFLSIGNDFKTKEISIFKNGTAYYIKKGKLKSINGSTELSNNLPKPLFGTLWFHSANSEIKAVSSFTGKVKTMKDATVFHELLKANKGKRVKIITKNKEFNGAINVIAPHFITLKSGDTYSAILPSDITSFEFLDQPNFKLEEDVASTIIRLDYSNNTPTQNVDMMYLQDGLGWIPNYLIQLYDNDKAKIQLRANVFNDAEDFEDVDLHFVVGVPSFKFRHLFSPLTSGESLATFLNAASGTRRTSNAFDNSFSNNILAQNTSRYIDGDNANLGTANTEFTGLSGDSEEDLFFYNLNKVSLKKGGRAFYTIFKTEVPVEHVYESNLQQAGTGDYYSRFSFAQEKNKTVYHTIKIKNNTQFPFTTGTAMVTKVSDKGERPISQDELYYTPSGGTSYMKITESTDIKVEQYDEEVQRMGKKVYESYSYQELTVSGTIKLKNFKKEKVKMRIKRTIFGELLKTNQEWQKSFPLNTYHSLNQQNDVCWEFELKDGEEKEIKYSYKLWVRI